MQSDAEAGGGWGANGRIQMKFKSVPDPMEVHTRGKEVSMGLVVGWKRVKGVGDITQPDTLNEL